MVDIPTETHYHNYHDHVEDAPTNNMLWAVMVVVIVVVALLFFGLRLGNRVNPSGVTNNAGNANVQTPINAEPSTNAGYTP